MQIQTGIWIDGKKAIIISLRNGIEDIHEIFARIDNPVHHSHEGDKGSFMGARHINNEKKFSNRILQQENDFLESIVEQLYDSSELFVFGPSDMKFRLRSKIEASHAHKNKLKGIEPADYISLNQCVEKVKIFFR